MRTSELISSRNLQTTTAVHVLQAPPKWCVGVLVHCLTRTLSSPHTRDTPHPPTRSARFCDVGIAQQLRISRRKRAYLCTKQLQTTHIMLPADIQHAESERLLHDGAPAGGDGGSAVQYGSRSRVGVIFAKHMRARGVWRIEPHIYADVFTTLFFRTPLTGGHRQQHDGRSETRNSRCPAPAAVHCRNLRYVLLRKHHPLSLCIGSACIIYYPI